MEFSTLVAVVVGFGVQFVLGTLFGCWLRAPKPEVDNEQQKTELNELIEKQRKQAEEMHETMFKLHELTGNIGQNMNDHAGRMQEINSDLATAVADDDSNLKSTLLDAVSEVTKANEQLQDQLKNAEAKLVEQAKTIEKHMAAARTDALTGVLNRRAFDEEIGRRVSEFQRYRTPVSLLMADIDYFKKFNDSHGHQAGDDVLKMAARTLQGAMRDVDFVCRYGGEEFAIIMPGTELTGGGMAAERARIAIEKAIHEFEGKVLKVTLSCGVASAMPGEDVASVIRRADEALYESKKAGRNCAHKHDGAGLSKVVMPAKGAPVEEAKQEDPEIMRAAATPDLHLDPLQRMPNSEAFLTELRRRLDQQRQYRTPVALAIGTLDDLVPLRSKYGEQGANTSMRAAAQFLAAAAREQDMVARLANDRFALIMPGLQTEDAYKTIQRVRKAIGKCEVPLDGEKVRLTLSFGLVESQEDDVADGLMHRAIEMLEQAIASGGNKIQAEAALVEATV